MILTEEGVKQAINTFGLREDETHHYYEGGHTTIVINKETREIEEHKGIDGFLSRAYLLHWLER